MSGAYSKAIDPPKFEAMDLAWRTLMDLGIVEGEDQKSRLTALGRHVSEGGSGLGLLSCYDTA
jgi:HrpA-like RNA helicase